MYMYLSLTLKCPDFSIETSFWGSWDAEMRVFFISVSDSTVHVFLSRYQEYMCVLQEREFQNTLQCRILETRKIAQKREQVKLWTLCVTYVHVYISFILQLSLCAYTFFYVFTCSQERNIAVYTYMYVYSCVHTCTCVDIMGYSFACGELVQDGMMVVYKDYVCTEWWWWECEECEEWGCEGGGGV